MCQESARYFMENRFRPELRWMTFHLLICITPIKWTIRQIFEVFSKQPFPRGSHIFYNGLLDEQVMRACWSASGLR